MTTSASSSHESRRGWVPVSRVLVACPLSLAGMPGRWWMAFWESCIRVSFLRRPGSSARVTLEPGRLCILGRTACAAGRWHGEAGHRARTGLGWTRRSSEQGEEDAKGEGERMERTKGTKQDQPIAAAAFE